VRLKRLVKGAVLKAGIDQLQLPVMKPDGLAGGIVTLLQELVPPAVPGDGRPVASVADS
jgi:hypothetical protein